MKKIYKSIFMAFVFMSIMPLQGMFPSLKKSVQQKSSIGTRSFSSKSSPVVANITKQRLSRVRATASSTSRIDILRAQVMGFLREQYARLWKKEPPIVMPKKLSVPVNIVEIDKSDGQIESEEILAKLEEPNPWNNLFEKRIKNFLEKNSVNDIGNVFDRLIATEQGFEILNEMSTNDGSFAVKLLPLVEKKFDHIKDDYFIKNIIVRIPADRFVLQTDSLKEKFLNRASLPFIVMSGVETVAKLLPNNSAKCLKALINMHEKWLAENKDIGSDLRSGYRKLGEFLKNSAVEKLAHITVGNVKELVSDEDVWKTELGTQLIRQLVSDNSQFKDLLVNYLINNKYLWRNSTGFDLMKQHAAEDSTFRDSLVDSIKGEKDVYVQQLTFLILLEVLEGSPFLELVLGIDGRYSQTPSYRHLKKYYHYLKDWDNNIESILNPVFTNMIQELMRNEKELIDNGFEVVYHGRNFEYHFLSYIYKKLYSYKSGEDLKDFIFTHLDDPVLGKVSEFFLKSEQEARERLLAQGNLLPTSGENTLESFLGKGSPILFLSKYAFGNLTVPGCNSMYLMLQNKNWGEITITTQEVFSMFGYKDIYDKYEKELSRLKSEHKSLSKHGELLQIAIPKNDVDKYIYHTKIGVHGPREKFAIPGIGETDDTKVIVDDVDKNPVDPIEFALVNTRDTKRTKVSSHTLVRPIAMEIFEEKLSRLFDEILPDCQKKDEQEKQKAIEWEKAQLASE